VLWFSHNPDLLIGPSSHFRLSVNNQSLTIDDVQPSDERQYGCQATNSEGATEPVYQQVRVAGQPIVIMFNIKLIANSYRQSATVELRRVSGGVNWL